ncbi:MAG: hypothetical protein FWE16_00105 [Firmicutes bacterium]|nr:hypothetical protein [Bacillota bacterium]
MSKKFTKIGKAATYFGLATAIGVGGFAAGNHWEWMGNMDANTIAGNKYENMRQAESDRFDEALSVLGLHMPENFDVEQGREQHLEDTSADRMAQAEAMAEDAIPYTGERIGQSTVVGVLSGFLSGVAAAGATWAVGLAGVGCQKLKKFVVETYQARQRFLKAENLNNHLNRRD